MTNQSPQTKPNFAVLGAGHGGLAMAGHLAVMGFQVNLYNRSKQRLWGVNSMGGITLEGEVEGFGKINKSTTNIEEAISDVDLIMVVVPATGHSFIAEKCAPFLKDGQVVVLNPGRTFGAIEFKQILNQKNCKADVIIAEAQTFIYASRTIGPGHSKIFRIKNSIPVAAARAHLIPEVLKKLRIAYPQFVAGDNVLKTSFDNIGAVFHPTLCVLNAGWIEDEANFQFYAQGVTPSTALILEKVDNERVTVAEALGIRALTARDWLYLAYGAVGSNLFEAMRANLGYRGLLAPTRLKMRYLTEDVPTSLVPIASVGKKFGVPTPTIDAIIDFSSILLQTDFRSIGRTVEKLGIQDMSLKDLRLLAIGEK
ncbi:MAG: NAD/NADP octopine/nopaline dehydrogenase family protein [Bacteroidetes bacterium]|nr:NAD/NADP octopine/nopaline dehydrogenase family protein [Bacteroidota bacterium]